MTPGTSAAICALCRRGHDLHSPCSTAVGDEAGRIGEVLGDRYELVRLLGAGGMGVVYEARHRLVGRRFAVKLLHPQYANQPSMLTRFQREARAAGSLENDNIAAVTDFGFAPDGAPYLVMEHLAGEDLAALVAREGPLPVARAVSFVIQACRGLAAAHAKDIVHRDLKPANLFLTRRGDGADLVKVLDFGIAKLIDSSETGASITGTGKLLGTASYMPPEQARGESDLDHRIDVYALGAILYELLTATKAHPGTNYNAVLFHILTQKPDPIGLRRADVPAGLARVIARAGAFDRADRHESVSALLADLLPFSSGESVTARPSPHAKRTVVSRAETIGAPATEAPADSPRIEATAIPAAARRASDRPIRVRLAVGLAALALVFGVLLLMRGNKRAPPAPASAVAAANRGAAALAPAVGTTAPATSPSVARPVVLPGVLQNQAPPVRAASLAHAESVPAAPSKSPSRRAPRSRRSNATVPATDASARERAAKDFDTRNPYDE